MFRRVALHNAPNTFPNFMKGALVDTAQSK